MTPIYFRRKQYGYGWYPASWQGWLITGIFILLIIFASFLPLPYSIISCIILAFLLIFIAYKTGETPRWQWEK